MKRIHFLLAMSALVLITGRSFALQGRGQGRTGGPSIPGVAGQANPSNAGGGNSGQAGSSGNHQASGNQPANPRNGESTHDPEGFKNYGQYMAAKHISENLGIPLADLRSKMTGPPPESLGQAIQELKGLSPAAANAEAKKAEQQAKNEGKKK